MPSLDSSRNASDGGEASSGSRGKRRKWRLVPIVNFINWKQEPGFQPLPNAPWFSAQRFWEGRVIHITVKHFGLRLDFRYDWVADLTGS